MVSYTNEEAKVWETTLILEPESTNAGVDLEDGDLVGRMSRKKRLRLRVFLWIVLSRYSSIDSSS